MVVNERIEGFDTARALAILGMILVNYSIVFGQGQIKYESIHWVLTLLEGRAAAVFLILAGIGIGLMTQKCYTSGDTALRLKAQKTIGKRAVYLWVLGMGSYIFLGWTADILHYYGVYMLLLIFVVYFTRRALAVTAGLILCLSLILQITLDYTQGWDFDAMYYLDINTPLGFMRHTFFNGFHPVFPWLAFMVLGLGLSRMDLESKPLQRKLFFIGLLAALSLEGLSLFAIHIFNGNEWSYYLLDTKPMNPSFLYMLASSAWAIAFIAGILRVTSMSPRFKPWTYLGQTGKMALSHYVCHFLLVLGFFDIYDGLAYRHELFVVVLSLSTFAAMIVFSNLWLKKFSRGPLELLMRRICR